MLADRRHVSRGRSGTGTGGSSQLQVAIVVAVAGGHLVLVSCVCTGLHVDRRLRILQVNLKNGYARLMANPRQSFCYDNDPRGLSLLEEDERYELMSRKESLYKFHAVSTYITLHARIIT